MSGYCFMSIKKMGSTKDMTLAYNHNYRLDDVKNVDASLTSQNEEIVSLDGKTYAQAFQEKINGLDYYQTNSYRKDAVRGMEILLAFSRSERDNIDIEKWKEDNITWLRQTFNADPLKYGDNVVSAVYHADEAGNPHIHAFVIPIDGKGHLNAAGYMNGPKGLRQLQSSYGEMMSQNHHLKRGREGSVAKHTDIKRFYENVNQAVSTTGLEVLPGETAEKYKLRNDEHIKNLMLSRYAKELEIQKKADDRVTDYKSKITVKNKEIKELKEKVSSLDKSLQAAKVESYDAKRNAERLKGERAELEQELGPLPTVRKKLSAMDALSVAFNSYPDEAERERVRIQMNEYIRWGTEQMQKERKGEKAREK